MLPELLLIVAGLLGAGGLGSRWWERRAQRDHVNRVRTEWVRAGHRVFFGPTAAFCYGQRPPHRHKCSGALGLADQQVIFAGRGTHHARIPFASIRRIELRSPLLAVHYEESAEWYISLWTTPDATSLAHELSSQLDLPVHPLDLQVAAERAQRLVQDVYGDWHADREDDVYIGAGALFFGWRKLFALDQITGLVVYPRRLRIEYQAEGETQIIGFDLPHARKWADLIARQIDVPLLVQDGRKKKPG